MDFSDLRFWCLLFYGLAIILASKFFLKSLPKSFDKLALLSLGLFLLFSISKTTFLIFLAVSIGSYIGLKWILNFHKSSPAPYLFILIPIQLLPLLFYKYGDFIIHTVFNHNFSGARIWLSQNLIGDIPALRDLIIPVGISFYTFQKVAFVLDTLAFKRPLPQFIDYLNFAAFFPQIAAGPIERRDKLLPQMEEFRFTWNAKNFDEGVSWIVLGLFLKCCLADNLAAFFDRSSTLNPYAIWLANVLFGLRIYYDFAGYSLMAVGLARCLGISLTLNFTSPYCSVSSTEFWRRWHITLSQWFRDYLYFPLGGGRVKWWFFNVALVFIISGLWHGAGWNFLLWGALHGLFLILNRLFGSRLNLSTPFAWALTMVASFYAWLCFYETNTNALFQKLKTLFTPSAYNLHSLTAMSAQYDNIALVQMLAFLCLTGIVLILEWRSISKYNEPYFLLRHPLVLPALILLTILLAPQSNNGFVYFAF